MLTPEYLAATPDALVELYGKIEQDILANMAERIAKYDYYIPAVQHQHQRLRAMGMLETEIEQQLAALTGKTQAELKKLMAQAGGEAMRSSFSYSELEKLLEKHGFLIYELLMPEDIQREIIDRSGADMKALEHVSYCLAVKKK